MLYKYDFSNGLILSTYEVDIQFYFKTYGFARVYPPLTPSTSPLHLSASMDPICSWSFLSFDWPLAPPPKQPSQPPSFAEALCNTLDIPLSQLCKPCLKGESISIKISEEKKKYKKGLYGCKNSFYELLSIAKGIVFVKISGLS